MNTVTPVILCGGSGTRLWPLSRAGYPKQFLVLSGDQSLFQQAVAPNDALLEEGARRRAVCLCRCGQPHFRVRRRAYHPFARALRGLVGHLACGALQLLAYHAALVKGTDVDKPRNLAKSVTVE